VRARALQERLTARLRSGEQEEPATSGEAIPASMFFDAYPRFYETTQTSASQGRLNLRYEAIFAQNADVFRGARVLDIACHDGRWSLAALRSGAATVTGIEAREDLVAAARENLDLYAPGSQADFVVGDVFEVLANERFDVDVVLCLGFLYHTLRYNELMRGIRDLDPRHLIVDTAVLPNVKKTLVRLRPERTERARNAVADRFSYGDQVVVGTPSFSALKLILKAYGFEIERLSDWDALVRGNPGAEHVGDYADGGRVTALCVSKD
jgi:hypothetical protein